MSINTSSASPVVHSTQRVDTILLLLRIASALAFLYHGSGILFGAFGGPGIHGFAAYTKMPVAVAALVGLAQFCGGLAILTGVLTRLGATCVAIVMLGAIFMVHLPKGFDSTKGGIEYALTQFLIAVCLMITGAGNYSLATLFASRKGNAGTGNLSHTAV